MQSQILAGGGRLNREGELASAIPKRRPNLSLTAEITLTGETRDKRESGPTTEHSYCSYKNYCPNNTFAI